MRAAFTQCGGATIEMDFEKKRPQAMLTTITPTT